MARRSLSRLIAFGVLVFAASAHANWTSDPTVGLPVCTSAGDQGLIDILADGYGGAWIAWMDDRGGAAARDIYVQHILAAGVADPAWPPNGLLVCGALRHQQAPVLASDGAGGAFVAWHDFRLSNGNPDVYVHHILATGALDPAWPTWGVQASPDLGYQYPPQIMADGAGGAYVCFGSVSANNDVRLQHVLPSGVVDPAWTAYGVLLCTATGDQFFPKMISDGGTGVVIGWEDRRTGTGDIYATHVFATGVIDPAWPVNGRALCMAAGGQEGVVLVSDGAGGALVAWRDLRTDAVGDVYAQRVFADGSVDGRWPADGRAVCDTTGQQGACRIVSDGAQGCVITWLDKRGSDFDVYGQHVLADGAVAPGAIPNGFALCTAGGDQQHGAVSNPILPDGSGGAFLVWNDARTGATTKDIYAMHVLPTGAPDPLWPANGRAVCSAANDQGGAVLCADGSGGFLATWADKRGGTDYDVYAQRVTANGELPNVGVGGDSRGPAIRLEVPYPNPSRGSAVFRYSLPREGAASLRLLDVAGRRVRGLTSSTLPAGWHETRWDMRDDVGRPVPNGLYFAMLVWAGEEVLQKFTVLR